MWGTSANCEARVKVRMICLSRAAAAGRSGVDTPTARIGVLHNRIAAHKRRMTFSEESFNKNCPGTFFNNGQQNNPDGLSWQREEDCTICGLKLYAKPVIPAPAVPSEG